MAKQYTWQQLEKRAARVKAREVYLDAQKLNPVAKPYKPEGDKTTWYAYSFEDVEILVEIPVFSATNTKISASAAALGLLTGAAAIMLTNSSILEFKVAHKQVLRITVFEANAAPKAKNTPWGTRVVDTIDNSYSFPFSLGPDTSPTVKEAKLAFNTLFGTGGALVGLLNKKGSYAALSFRGKVLDTFRK